MSNSDFFSWDDVIESDSEFILLDEGDYDYEVTKLDKTYAQKTGAPMAVITLNVTGNGGSNTIIDRLVLQKNCEWKLSQFFRSIGQKKHGEPLRMDWNKVLGSKGRCKVSVDTYTKKDGSEGDINKIERYYDPVEPTPAPSPSAVPWQ